MSNNLNKTIASCKKSNIIYFDILNIISCIAVIALHHNGIVHSYSATRAWKESLIVECFAYWAVPIFMMLTGATLLNYRKKYSTEEFFKKRLSRTVFPWLFWSIVLLIGKVMSGQMTLENTSIRHIGYLIFNFKVESTYWYFGQLFPIYLCIPVISCLADNKKILWYLTGLCLIFNSILPLIKGITHITLSFSLTFGTSLTVFLLLGYLLSQTQLSKKQRLVLYGLGFLGGASRYVYTLLCSMAKGSTDTSIKGYAMIHSVFLAVSVFVFIQNVDWKNFIPARCLNLLSQISSCSFGIYLIHKVVMHYELSVFHILRESFLWRTVWVFVTYFICLSIVMAVRKIPYMRKIFGL